MKRWLVGLVVSALFFFGSLSVAAADFTGKVDGAYLFGTFNSGDSPDFDMNGFLIGAEASVFEPFGIKADLGFLTADLNELKATAGPSSEWKLTDLNVYATYDLPLPGEGFKVKALGGYGQTSLDFGGSDNYEFKGFKLGAAAEFVPVEKVTLEASVALGLGNKISYDDNEADAKVTTYRIAGSYAVTESIAVLAGYTASDYKLTEHDEDHDFMDVSGFFVGARATF